MRSILYQYMAAPFLLWGANDEFYLRLFPVCCNIIAFWPFYKLSKKISGSFIACIAVTIFSLSLWEIEFARFARMYAPFQALFLFYILFLYKLIVNNDHNSWKWLWVISCLSLFIYEGSIFLLILNFLPFFLDKSQFTIKRFLICLIIFLVGYFYLSFNFQNFGQHIIFPKDMPVHNNSTGKISSPLLLVSTIHSILGWGFFGILSAISLFLIYKLFKSGDFDYRIKILFSACALLSLLNLFALIASIIFLSLTLNIINFAYFKKKELQNILILIFCSLIFWITYCFLSKDWLELFQHLNQFSLKKMIVILTKYPDVYEQIIYPWINWIPKLSLVLTFFILMGIIETTLVDYKKRRGYLLLLSIVILLSLVIGVLKTPTHTTRYTYFLYPIIILLSLVSVRNIAFFLVKNRNIALIGTAFFFFLAFTYTEDFNLGYIKNIDSIKNNFRIHLDKKLSYNLFIRYDWKHPSEFINSNMSKQDIVVSINSLPSSYYLRRVDYIFLSRDFRQLVRCNGTKERWSNADVIYKKNNLFNLLDTSTSTVWLIARSASSYNYHNELISSIADKYKNFKKYSGIDGRFNVYKISPSTTRNILK